MLYSLQLSRTLSLAPKSLPVNGLAVVKAAIEKATATRVVENFILIKIIVKVFQL